MYLQQRKDSDAERKKKEGLFSRAEDEGEGNEDGLFGAPENGEDAELFQKEPAKSKAPTFTGQCCSSVASYPGPTHHPGWPGR